MTKTKKTKPNESVAKSTSRIIKEKIQISAYSLGNTFETAGRKLQHHGYDKIGSNVLKVGNKISRMGEQTYHPINNTKTIIKEKHL